VGRLAVELIGADLRSTFNPRLQLVADINDTGCVPRVVARGRFRQPRGHLPAEDDDRLFDVDLDVVVLVRGFSFSRSTTTFLISRSVG
jgi:hypothetical protein